MRPTQVILALSAVLMLAGACGQQVDAENPAGQVRAGNNAVGSDTVGGDTAPGDTAPGDTAPGDVESAPVPGSGKSSLSPGPGQAEPVPVPRDQIDATALPEGHPVEATVSADGRTLTVVGQEGGCGRVSAELTEQTTARVVVRMVETKPKDKNTVCTMDMRYPPLTVELDAPLGERHLVLDHLRDGA